MNDDPGDLPFPQPINRSAFAAADFDSTEFLSSLNNRFQTLEDLQNELRELSQSLSRELIDLVNDNYQDFLSLGSTLSGGDDKVEDVRVGLLGFQRDVSGVRDKIDARQKDVGQLLAEKKELRRQVAHGRTLLDIDEKLDDLEIKLGLKGDLKSKTHATDTTEAVAAGLKENSQSQWSDDWSETHSDVSDGDDSSETNDAGVPTRLRNLTASYRTVKALTTKIDSQPQSQHDIQSQARHPFLAAQTDRIARIKAALVRDLEAAIRLEDSTAAKQRLVALRAAVE